MKLEPIRLRLVPRQPLPEQANPRDAFWRAIRRPDEQDDDISESEGKLRKDFGPALRYLLIQELSEPLRQIEQTLYRGEFRDLEHFLFRFFEGPSSDKGWDRSQALDAFTRLIEQRQQVFRDSPALRRAQERVAAASSVNFSVRLAGYSSLSLDLSVGSLKSAAEAFENDFESFRVFLEAFIPQAFGRIFWDEDANRLDFTVQVPAAYEQAFVASPPQQPSATQPPAAALQPAAATPPVTPARERAEWLWRLANGSLLVPLLLALVVMYYGLAMLKDLRGSQNEALKPILEHQLKLLEEDRRRLFKEPPASTPAASTASTPIK
jgi:hypothetical protein